MHAAIRSKFSKPNFNPSVAQSLAKPRAWRHEIPSVSLIKGSVKNSQPMRASAVKLFYVNGSVGDMPSWPISVHDSVAGARFCLHTVEMQALSFLCYFTTEILSL